MFFFWTAVLMAWLPVANSVMVNVRSGNEGEVCVQT